MALSPKTEALIARSLLGLALVEIPVVTFQLSQPVFDYKLLAVGVLGALAGFLDKQFSPQIANVILPDTKVDVPTAPAAAVATLDDLPRLVAELKARRQADDALLASLAGAAAPTTEPPAP